MTQDKDPKFLSEIKERVEKASPDPWYLEEDSSGAEYDTEKWPYQILSPIPHPKMEGYHTCVANMAETDTEISQTYADSDFIAHARTDIPTLLDYINVLSQALRVARHEMVTSRGVHATDRPDLVTMPSELSWVIDPSKAIETVDKALSWAPEEGE